MRGAGAPQQRIKAGGLHQHREAGELQQRRKAGGPHQHRGEEAGRSWGLASAEGSRGPASAEGSRQAQQLRGAGDLHQLRAAGKHSSLPGVAPDIGSERVCWHSPKWERRSMSGHRAAATPRRQPDEQLAMTIVAPANQLLAGRRGTSTFLYSVPTSSWFQTGSKLGLQGTVYLRCSSGQPLRCCCSICSLHQRPWRSACLAITSFAHKAV